MGHNFKIFLVSLLAFCVLFGAFCIVYPIVSQKGDTNPQIQAPQAPDTPDSPENSGNHDAASDEPDTPSEPAQPSPNLQRAQLLLSDMSLEEKVYQLFIVTPEALTGVGTVIRAGEATGAALEAQPVGGIIYFAKNLKDREQTIEMLENSQSYSNIPLFLSVDEEGGIVSRVGSNPAMGATAFSNMADYGDLADPQRVYDIGVTIGSDLTALGFNLDFAPVADVVTNSENTEIGRRSFSSDPYVAAKMVSSIVEGMNDAGILSTLKHFPGHGGTATDSHNGLSVTERTLDEMRQSEFLPFQSGIAAGAPLVMVGHLSAPQITGDNTPSCLSSIIVSDILRGELGFDGVIITDAQNMGAITNYYQSGNAAVAALKAGVDIVLMPQSLEEAVAAVLEAIEQGRLSEERIDESVLRILTLKYDYGIIPEDF